MPHHVAELLLPDEPSLKMSLLMYRNMGVMKLPVGHYETTTLNLVSGLSDTSACEICLLNRVLLRKNFRLEDYKPQKQHDR